MIDPEPIKIADLMLLPWLAPSYRERPVGVYACTSNDLGELLVWAKGERLMYEIYWRGVAVGEPCCETKQKRDT